MDDREPTAWEETTGQLARPAEWAAPSMQRSGSSLADNRAKFAAAVTPCLQLVAPVGMDLESQDMWLEAAWKALKHLPADLLKQGCAKAMRVCDHPAKIVPTIIADTEEQLRNRKASIAPSPVALPSPQMAPRPLSREELDTMPDDIREMGLSSGFLSIVDGKLIETARA